MLVSSKQVAESLTTHLTTVGSVVFRTRKTNPRLYSRRRSFLEIHTMLHAEEMGEHLGRPFTQPRPFPFFVCRLPNKRLH